MITIFWRKKYIFIKMSFYLFITKCLVCISPNSEVHSSFLNHQQQSSCFQLFNQCWLLYSVRLWKGFARLAWILIYIARVDLDKTLLQIKGFRRDKLDFTNYFEAWAIFLLINQCLKKYLTLRFMSHTIVLSAILW